jgi:hypothetical protein
LPAPVIASAMNAASSATPAKNVDLRLCSQAEEVEARQRSHAARMDRRTGGVEQQQLHPGKVEVV